MRTDRKLKTGQAEAYTTGIAKIRQKKGQRLDNKIKRQGLTRKDGRLNNCIKKKSDIRTN